MTGKRMTQREKKARAEFRARMRKEGILPPCKKPLNRKKFIKDAQEDFQATIRTFSDCDYLAQATSWMTATERPTLEHVGAAKVLKLACEIKRFELEVKEAGRTTYKWDDLYKRIEPILNA